MKNKLIYCHDSTLKITIKILLTILNQNSNKQKIKIPL
jgi:hypothetical protein